ncbi:hypothetical protein T03_448 [Trichinella britovi]|uniref:Uncharacterized protein n=1 Tax=Trichinella britovi TaxID=45882 RepID=A0A0V1CGK9_TRIBR|nr:hypothetical protein T03_448 [Trichinella britovi]
MATRRDHASEDEPAKSDSGRTGADPDEGDQDPVQQSPAGRYTLKCGIYRNYVNLHKLRESIL